MENSRASLFKKMASVMGELQRIPKHGFNPDQKYEYATAEDIKNAVRQAMAKHNLALLVELSDYEIIEIKSQRGTVGTKLRGNIHYTLCCGETGETTTVIMPNEVIDWQDKAFSKLYTIGLKYFLINTFQISTGDEDDSDAAPAADVSEVNQPQRKQSKPESKPTNGNGKSPVVTNPQQLLEVVNKRVLVPYDNVNQLFDAVREESTIDSYAWPAANDIDAWRKAYELAVSHAKKKTNESEPPK